MHHPPQGHESMDRQKSEYIPGQDDAADHEAYHGEYQEDIDYEDCRPHGIISALKQVPVPGQVQDIMQDK